VCLALASTPAGARHFQRSLALAEAEFDQAGGDAASDGAGGRALRAGTMGAYKRGTAGIRLAECCERRTARRPVERQTGGAGTIKHAISAVAGEFLRRARRFEAAAWRTRWRRAEPAGLLDAQLGRHRRVRGVPRSSAWAQRAPRDARLELSIRLNLAELDLLAGRLLEAERSCVARNR